MDEAIDIVLPDIVPVTDRKTTTHHPGIIVGAWFVWFCATERKFGRPAEENWDVGHIETGTHFPVVDGVQFWDALRLARALDDAFPATLYELADHFGAEWWCVAESVAAAALVDHYVFPIDRYMEAV